MTLCTCGWATTVHHQGLLAHFSTQQTHHGWCALMVAWEKCTVGMLNHTTVHSMPIIHIQRVITSWLKSVLRLSWLHHGHYAPILDSCIVFSIFYGLIFYILFWIVGCSSKEDCQPRKRRGWEEEENRGVISARYSTLWDPKHRACYRQLKDQRFVKGHKIDCPTLGRIGLTN